MPCIKQAVVYQWTITRHKEENGLLLIHSRAGMIFHSTRHILATEIKQTAGQGV